MQGTAPAWHCAHVTIRQPDVSDGGDTTTFPVEQWFSAEMGDGRTEREIFPKPKGKNTYRVCVTFAAQLACNPTFQSQQGDMP